MLISSRYTAASLPAPSVSLPTVKPMILLKVVDTVIFMSNNEQNALIVLIYDTMLSATGGYGYASAMAWLYSIVTFIIGMLAASWSASCCMTGPLAMMIGRKNIIRKIPLCRVHSHLYVKQRAECIDRTHI